jgi:hypothetical protein
MHTSMPTLAKRVAADPPSRLNLHTSVCARLGAEFVTIPGDVVDRCVSDVRARAEHLGVEATPLLVERIAREHLLAMVNSSPPSRR